MIGSRWLGGMGAWCLGIGCLGVAVGGDLSTVAYHLDREGYERIVSDWGEGRPEVGEDPFATDGREPQAVEQPFLVETVPAETRFFKEGDRMWMVTKVLWELDVLEDDAGWAVWNESTNRLVVRGTRWEQAQVERICRSLDAPILIGTEVELLRVPCRELGAVAWSPEEVRKRGSVGLGVVATTGRPGQEASTALAMPDGEGRLAVEANIGGEHSIVDLRVKYSVPVSHGDAVRRLALSTAMAVYSGHNVFYELGGADDEGMTYLVRVMAVPRFLDGTPRWRWRETEDETLAQAPPEPVRRGLVRTVLNDGLVLCRVMLPPNFLEDITDSEVLKDGTDPFAPADAETERKLAGGLKSIRVIPPDGVPGCRKTDVVFDVGRILRDLGLAFPEAGWAYFNLTRSFLVAKLDAANAVLLDALVDCACIDPPRMIHTTVILIEWEGERPSGQIPAGARRLARAGVVCRPGQKGTLRHGWPGEELKRGVEMELEPSLGATNRVVDMRVFATVAGERRVEMSTGLALVSGVPVVVPVGEVDGKKLGMVLECRLTDGAGTSLDR